MDLRNAPLNPKVAFSTQLRAVLLKNLTLTIRQRKSLIFFGILTIILMLIPILVMRLAFPSEPSGPSPELRLSRSIYEYSWFRIWSLYYWAVFDESGVIGSLPESRNLINSKLYSPELLGASYQQPFEDSYYLWSDEQNCIPIVGYKIPSGTSNQRLLLNTTKMFTKELTSVESLEAWMNRGTDPKYCRIGQANLGVHVKPGAKLDLNEPYKLEADIYVPKYTDAQNLLDHKSVFYNILFIKSLNNYTYDVVKMNETRDQEWTPQIIPGMYSSLPSSSLTHNKRLQHGTRITFTWIFAMLSLSFLVPMLTQRIVIERADGLNDLSTMMGLSRTAHWLGHFIIDYAFYIIIYLITVFMTGIIKSDILSAQGSGWVIAGSLLYGVTTIATSYMIAFMFRTTRSSLIFGYIFSLIQFALAAVFNMLLTRSDQMLPAYLLWWPHFSYFKLTYEAFHIWVDPSLAPSVTPILRNSIIIMFFETLAVIGIVFALDRWSPSRLGNRGTLWNMIVDLINKFILMFTKKSKDYVQLLPTVDSEPNMSADLRVAEERNRVLSGDTSDAVMVIRNLSKVYIEGANSFVALEDINFALNQGDCFGLLGPNGAGKSTLVAIMSGLIGPTTGSVSINADTRRCAIGLCPQDDIFYADLTVEEHLLYYSRLKGKTAGEDQKNVDNILADVSMANERRLYASNLSGGQKRRLSVGSSLCGDPMVIFLDEPSSSLDPGSRLGLWEVIQNISKTRCTLLTTHSMEEAEVLCNRIGIIKDGHMVCMGTPSQLKNSYGQGYKLVINLAPKSDVSDVLDVLKNLAPSAKVVSQKHGYSEIQLGKDAILSKVSDLMEKNKKSLGVLRWSLARNGLDEVFLHIVEDRRLKPRKAMNPSYDALV